MLFTTVIFVLPNVTDNKRFRKNYQPVILDDELSEIYQKDCNYPIEVNK